MLRLTALLFCILTLGSCSNLSKNFDTSGEFVLKGGTFQNSKWKDELVFSRSSWFHEVTLLYDFLNTRVDPRSPFYDWFSNGEKELLASCSDAYLIVDYSLDSKKVSKKMVENDAKRAGYEKIAVTNFKTHLQLHPDSDVLSLLLYDVYGLCYKGELSQREKVVIRVPGFQEVVIK